MKKLIAVVLLLFCTPAFALTIKYSDDRAIYTMQQIQTTLIGNVTNTITAGAVTHISIQCVHASVAQPQQITYKLQVSNDESNWDDLAGATSTTTGASGSSTLIIDPFVMEYARINISNSSLVGTLDCKATGRRR